jgi:hypothetical protein
MDPKGNVWIKNEFTTTKIWPNPQSHLQEKQNYHFKLNDSVEIEDFPDDTFVVVGVRENELELLGDWIGGTAGSSQKGWYRIDKIKPILKKLEWIKIR